MLRKLEIFLNFLWNFIRKVCFKNRFENEKNNRSRLHVVKRLAYFMSMSYR